jgi:branched-chain amino acid transport system permease protein
VSALAATAQRIPRGLPRELVGALAVIVVGLVLAGGASPFHAQQWTSWLIYGLLALSFTFIWGHGGIFSFGQAAFFGIGGYTYGVVAINRIDASGETITAVLVAIVVAALAAGLLGYFIFYGNVGEVYVAIITLATSLVLLTFMSSTAGPQYHIGDAQLGGYNGMVGIPPLSYGKSDGVPQALTNQQLLELFVVLAVLVVLGLRILLRRPFGRVLIALRTNEPRTQLLGYDVRRHKLLAFMLGGAIAGLAGAGYAAWGLFINPAVFALSQAAMVAIYVLVGGRSSLLGAFVGVVVIEEVSSWLGGSGSTATPIVLGSLLIVVVLVLPQGVVPGLRALVARVLPGAAGRAPSLPPPRRSPPATGSGTTRPPRGCASRASASASAACRRSTASRWSFRRAGSRR